MNDLTDSQLGLHHEHCSLRSGITVQKEHASERENFLPSGNVEVAHHARVKFPRDRRFSLLLARSFRWTISEQKDRLLIV